MNAPPPYIRPQADREDRCRHVFRTVQAYRHEKGGVPVGPVLAWQECVYCRKWREVVETERN